MDVHVPIAVTRQLRLRHVDVLTAQDDEAVTMTDENLLHRATGLSRVLVTQDIRFKALAERWQRDGTPFGGLVFAHQLRVSIGQLVVDLEILAKATDWSDWQHAIEELPL
jgi:hypothetical protein